MARQVLCNGETLSVIRTKINSMFAEVYGLNGLTFCGILNTGDSVKSTPDTGDYHIVRDAGTYGSVACQAYDWLIYNGSAWERLPGGTKGYVEVQTEADGSVDDGSMDPGDDEITHLLSLSYASDPEIIVQSMCDWSLYLKSVTLNGGAVNVIIGIGSYGSASELKYKLYAMI